MAVHLPLSAEAQAEARVLMLSDNNILSPANGRPLVTPTQDMVIGAFYLTSLMDGEKGEGRAFGDVESIRMAYENGDIAIHAKIQYRAGRDAAGKARWHTTTPRRVLFAIGIAHVCTPVTNAHLV